MNREADQVLGDIPATSDLEQPIVALEAESADKKRASRASSFHLAFGLPILYILLLFVESTRYIWTTITVILYVVVIIFALLWLLVTPVEHHGERTKQAGGEDRASASVILTAIALLICFSQLSKYLYMAFGGFVANGTGYWHWLRFGFANFFEGALLDIPSVYNWGVSEIQPSAFWSQTLVLLFRTSLEFLVVANVLKQFSRFRKNRSKLRSKDHSTYLAFLLARLGSLIPLIIWIIPTVIGIGAIVSDGLYLEASWVAIQLATPVVLGSWLAWQSMKGILRFSGSRNILLALAGIIAGTWLALANWPILSDYLGI